MRAASIKRIRWSKAGCFFACLLPLARLAEKGLTGNLGANPIEVITRSTGTYTLILLLVTLSVSPVRRLSRQYWLISLRRMLGLFAFFYATLHFLTYIWLDKFFHLHDMVKDVAKRPFITIGFTGFVLLIPLAATSTAGMIRRLGGKRWQKLHRLIYASALAGVVHYLWLVKADIRVPVIYGILLGGLLGYRVLAWIISGASGPHQPGRSPAHSAQQLQEDTAAAR